MKQSGRVLGGALLVAGTMIGAGMLALPVITGLMGFWPTLILFLMYFCLMAYSAMLFLEVNLWHEDIHVNLMTMARTTLGKPGQVVAWFVYLFLLYALTTAYMAASGPLFKEQLQYWTGMQMPFWAGPIPLLLIFSFFVYEGARYVDLVNRLLMLGLVVSFFALNGMLIPHMELDHLVRSDWSYVPLSVAILATSFGYHIIIPTLNRYLNKDVKGLLTSIALGSFFALLLYIVWEIVVLSVLPMEGEVGLLEGYKQGKDSVFLVSGLLGNDWVSFVGRWFLFFAIVTSFLGVSLSLRDFLGDGLGISSETALGRWTLYFLTFVPPLFFSIASPRSFFLALDYAGAFGVITLLILLPAMMVYRGRYMLGFKSEHFKAWGGKGLLIFVMLFSCFLIGIEVCNKLGVLTYDY